MALAIPLPRPLTSTVLPFREGIFISPLAPLIEPRQAIAWLYMTFREFSYQVPRMTH
jgi:hypothetical protein